VGYKDRQQMKIKQKVKRRKKRSKMVQKGLDPNEFYNGRTYVGIKDKD